MIIASTPSVVRPPIPATDIEKPVQVKINSLHGNLQRIHSIKRKYMHANEEQVEYCPSMMADPHRPELFVTCQLYADGKALAPEEKTGFGFNAKPYIYTQVQAIETWNDTITFPTNYRDLPLSSQLVFTIWTIHPSTVPKPCGGTSVHLFGHKQQLRKGEQKLFIWENVSGDGSKQSTTPGKQPKDATPIDDIERVCEGLHHLLTLQIIKKFSRGHIPHLDWLDRLSSQAIERINASTDGESLKVALFIELHDFDVPISYSTNRYNDVSSFEVTNTNQYIQFFDPLSNDPSPIEWMYKERALAMSKIRGISPQDRDLKPNVEEKKTLKDVINYPPNYTLLPGQKELVWNYRYFLLRTNRALTKFVKSVNWSLDSEKEAEEAFSCMEEWDKIDLEDALELLSGQYANYVFSTRIRSFAVRRLEQGSDAEIILYLLQLVQALRYDIPHLPPTGHSDLGNFLLRKAVDNTVIGNNLYWYTKVEADDSEIGKYYSRFLSDFTAALGRLAGKHAHLDHFDQQERILGDCTEMCAWSRKLSLTRQKKMEKLKECFSGPDAKYANLLSFANTPLPLDPTIMINGIGSDVYIFNSAMAPIKINVTGEQLPTPMGVMVKMGDDLRQDQLIVQLISLMDKLLKKEGLDLKLTPYKVLATSKSEGLLEIVPNSKNIADVLSNFGNDLKKFLRHHNPAPESPQTYDIQPVVLDNFVRSCAGYSVITYILGIGDRHLDNLLLTQDGKLFHIDFGFIMGRDPKPFPPPMEMVEGMGGKDSPFYLQFRDYACEAFNIFRKSARLILNLVNLMADAELVDIQGEKSILKLQEKLVLFKTDEEASKHLQTIINESVTALFPTMVEKVHKWAKYWRN